MMRPRLSIARAMGIVLAIGVVLGLLRSIEALRLSVVVAPLVLIFVWLLMIARERPSPFLWGFTVFGWAYYVSVFFLMNEIRANANNPTPPVLITSWLIDEIHNRFHPACDCDSSGFVKEERPVERPFDRETRRRIGHSAMTLLLGGMGGYLFHSYAASCRLRRDRQCPAGDPEDAVDVSS